MEPLTAPAVALVLARLLGLAATAPLLSDASVPLRARAAVIAGGALLLAPVTPQPAPGPAAIAFAAALELLAGAAAGATAAWALAAVEMAGHLVGASLGLSFAAQYDVQQPTQQDSAVALARVAAGLAFVATGGLAAMLAAAAQPAPWGAAPTSLAEAAALAWRTALASWHAGLGLAGPVLLAAFTGNLALAMAQRAVASAHVWSIGFPVLLGVVGAAALGGGDTFLAEVVAIAEHAGALLSGGR